MWTLERRCLPCINTYMWTLERRCWWAYLQGSKADADTENRLVDTVWEGEGGTNGESSMETHTLPYVKQDRGIRCTTHRAQTGALWQPGGEDRVGGGRGFKREGTHVHLWLIHVDVRREWKQCCKAIILQLKIKKNKRIHLQCRRRRRCWFDPWVGKIPWRGRIATHCGILAWEIPWTEKSPRGPQSVRSQRVVHDWGTKALPLSEQSRAAAKKCDNVEDVDKFFLKGKVLWKRVLWQLTREHTDNITSPRSMGKRLNL